MKVRIQGILKAGERFEETIEVPDEIGCGRTVTPRLIESMEKRDFAFLGDEIGVIVFAPENAVFLKVTSPFPPRP